MKFDTTIKTVNILFVMICLLCSSAFAKTMPTWPIEYSLETQDQLVVGEMISFSFGITPKHVSCDEITVSVETVSGLTYFGETYWTVPFKDKIETNYSFDVIIPDNDTCGLKITLSCGDYSNTINRYFITTSDSVEMIRGMPSIYPEGFIRPKFEGRIGNVIPGEFPEDDSLYGIPENPTLIDYQKEEYTQLTKEEAQLRKMHWLEREPLTDKDIQYHSIGNIRYERKRGESKFTIIKTYTEEEIQEQHLKRLDSLKANPPNHLYDMTINLTNKEDYEFVKQLVDSLIPTDSIGFFRAIVNKSMLNKLTFNKIKYDRTNRKKIVKLRDEKDHPAPKKKKRTDYW